MSVFHKQICDAFEKCSGSLSPMEENKELIYLPMLFKGDGQKRAAVLCVLREENDEIFALMTIRSNQLLRHPGEPCFPGGMEDKMDKSIEETALREAEEEVNLHRNEVQIVTTFPPCVSGFAEILQCFLVVCTLSVSLDQLNLKPNNEVEHIYWIPLKLFLSTGPHHWQENLPFRDLHIVSNFFRYSVPNYKQIVIWGMTAKLCILTAYFVYSQAPSFPFTLFIISSLNTESSKIVLSPLILVSSFETISGNKTKSKL